MKYKMVVNSILVVLVSLLLSSAPVVSTSARAPARPTVDLGQPGFSLRYEQTFGVPEVPYPADSAHLNSPLGLFVDGGDNVLVVEEKGMRALKYNSAGMNTLIIGHAGMPWAHDDYLDTPRDIAVDSGNNIWVVIKPAIKQYDASGNLLQSIPDPPWDGEGADDYHFTDARGIAFDTTGRMYVADSGNHRVQVYSFDLNGTAVYSTTLGVTGEPDSDSTHFNFPSQIVVDSSNRLYVNDVYNYRIQRCVYTAGWTCSTFHGTGYEGSGANELGVSWGIGKDSSDNFWIADGSNLRVKKCTSAGACSVFVTGIGFPKDVAVNSSNQVFVSGSDCIKKYNSSGVLLGTFAGVSYVPYLPGTTHLNQPWGVAVAPDGSIYIGENYGNRLVKLNAAGVQQWAIGQAGVGGDDNAHFGNWWGGIVGNPAVDSSGRVYAPDSNNHRVQIFNPDGSYFSTMGVSGEWGDDNNHFDFPHGVAISPVNGDIFVVDHSNTRIQVFNSSRVYKATLGVTDETGDDNMHFNYPRGVTVDKNGSIFVADTDNHRVQKCILGVGSYSCTTFAGETGVFGDDFGHLHPLSVAVDDSGRVYVADEWNARLIVYDTSGAFLTEVGHDWYGLTNCGFNNPSGVALDNDGNVLVADYMSHKVTKFAPGVPGWRQTNINGFGKWQNGVWTLEVFQDQLYAGAGNWDEGATVWRTGDGTTWNQVSEYGFSATYTNTNPTVVDMIVFNNQLYAGVGWGGSPGQVWRSSNGTSWGQVVPDGFGNSDNFVVAPFGIFNNVLYSATGNDNGVEIWRSATGNSGTWSNVASAGNGNTNNRHPTGFIQFGSDFYLAVENPTDGMEVWKTSDGATWARVLQGGFGDPDNSESGGFAILGNYLYLGTRNDTTGAQLWRTSNGANWDAVVSDGFGDLNNYKIQMLFVYEGELYAGTDNSETGLEVWKSPNGAAWVQINPDGFGNSNSNSTLWSVGTTVFKNMLIISANNSANGGQVWMMLKNIYLPLLKR